MSRPISYSDSLEVNPSGYTGLTSLTTTSSYPISNAYDGTDSTTYARLSLSTSTTGYLYLTFDVDLPTGAAVTSVAAQCRVHVSSTSRVTSTVCQMYSGTTAKGSNVAFASTSSTNIVTLSTGTSWGTSDMSDLRMRIGGTGSSSSQSKYIYLYGATVTITYTVDGTEYEITITNSTSATVSYEQWVMQGADTSISADDLTGITVTDNGTDITSQFVQTTGDTIAAYPGSYSTSGTISGTNYQQCIGKGSNNTSVTGNDYASSSGSTAYINYSFDFSDIPTGAAIQSVSVSVCGHCESTNSSSEVAKLQLYSGSTAKGSEVSFTSTSNTVVNMTTGTWSREELQSAVLRFTIGYYGGAISGVTWSVTYEQSGYVYTITNIGADHAIVFAYSGATGGLYVKLNGAWESVTRAYQKINGTWQTVAIESAFSSSNQYVKGN